MGEHKTTWRATRRAALQAGLAVAALPLTGWMTGAARAQDRKVTKVLDFTTGADVAKAEQEGEVVFYTHDSEPAAAGILEAFTKDFPKIKTSYVRAQTGALYAKGYVSHCTSFARSGLSAPSSRRRRESLAPCILCGASSRSGSYRDSFLSL